MESMYIYPYFLCSPRFTQGLAIQDGMEPCPSFQEGMDVLASQQDVDVESLDQRIQAPSMH